MAFKLKYVVNFSILSYFEQILMLKLGRIPSIKAYGKCQINQRFKDPE